MKTTKKFLGIALVSGAISGFYFGLKPMIGNAYVNVGNNNAIFDQIITVPFITVIMYVMLISLITIGFWVGVGFLFNLKYSKLKRSILIGLIFGLVSGGPGYQVFTIPLMVSYIMLWMGLFSAMAGYGIKAYELD